MSKNKIFNAMKKGKEKKVTIMDTEFVIVSPDLEDRTFMSNLNKEIMNRDKKSLDAMAKLIINCTKDVEGNFFFDKGDLELIKEDRSGIVEELLGEIAELMQEKETIEEAKKN